MFVIFIFMLLVNIPEIAAFALCAHNFAVDTPNPTCPEWLAHVPLSYLYYIVYTSFFAYYTYHIRTYPDRNVYLSNLRLAIISTLWSVGTVATFYGANGAQMDARAFCGYTSLLSIYTIEMYGNTLYDEFECEYRGTKPLSDEDEKDLITQRNKTLAGVGYYMNKKELYDILLEISKARYCDEIVMFLGGLCAAHRMAQTALDPRRSRNNSSAMKKSRRSQDSLAVSTGQLEEEDAVETCAKKYYLNDLVALYEQFIRTDGSHCVNVTHVLRVNVESALNDCKRAAHNSHTADAKRAFASKELAANMDTLAVNTIRLLSHSGVWEQFKNDERVLAMESRKEAMQKYGLRAANTSAPLSPSRRQSAVV
ncbi:hypothetical protein SARC_01136 [Sphaeroforma arctica JP610]|uniref:RGS domain-containing protein n=1 Tax=Sphaeroforma arctica JP610 TaxID=667725 RepID=A0A0L0GCV2_9EUKA|nr:hypothetical protein SARC_01136 [Sphaeroforma arctica JP610]KNC86716.1 hypothetical protein SARC_01136 [Sphaeroforma arctica JP610]|eukprot:XP_014160618.1 hypothetical protein SARC_01136 [Sphaeroforma arctica JP610]